MDINRPQEQWQTALRHYPDVTSSLIMHNESLSLADSLVHIYAIIYQLA